MSDDSAFLNSLQYFLATGLDALVDHSPADVEEHLLGLFRRTASQVPAYRDYLDRYSVSPESIHSLDDFGQLPLMTKVDYMQAYPLAQRCEQGSLLSCSRLAVSSGSTGQPTFWPRSVRHELDIAVRFEQVFRDSFRAHERRTLVVVCFAMGNWVGGLFTTSCCWHLANKGYPLMVATPGNNTAEIFRIVRALSLDFEQTVLLGYPPFIRDVVDAGIAEGIDWSACNLRMVFAGEVFSEEWRADLVRRTGAESPCLATASLYGTADGGVLGNETPFSIAVRRFLADHPASARELFGESRLPTLVQYDPCSRYFETHDETLVVSGDGGVPLIRYHIADKGGVISFAEMMDFLHDHQAMSGVNQVLAGGSEIRPLPFVYVFGRADFTVSFYGANVFPENVAVGLEQPDVMGWVTGKFVLEVSQDEDGHQSLVITVELRPGTAEAVTRVEVLTDSILRQLLRLNSEFGHYVPAGRQSPLVRLRPFGDADYFPVGVKHRYTRR